MNLPDPGGLVALRLIVVGRVQGVGYRAALSEAARGLALAGWVRNRTDGSVEVLVHGPALRVESLVDWARRGPTAARVDRVERVAAEAPSHPDFRIRPTA